MGWRREPIGSPPGCSGDTDPHDDSGVLRYVRVEFAGREISPDNELNGIVMGFGEYGLDIDHQQTFDNVDFVGGVDPASDWTQGWITTAQN